MIDVIFKPCYSKDNSYLQQVVTALENNGIYIINKNTE